MNTISARLGSHIEHGIPGSLGFGIKDLLLFGYTEAENIYERIERIAFVEIDFPPHSGHSDGIAITCNSSHNAVHDGSVFGFIQGPKTKRIHNGDGPGTHGEYVSQNTPDSCCCTLIRLDEGRVIVRFDLENDSQSIADIHDAGVFTWSLDDILAFDGQFFQMDF
jgi:hypothetical protein